MKKQQLKAYRKVWGGLPPRLKVGPHWWAGQLRGGPGGLDWQQESVWRDRQRRLCRQPQPEPVVRPGQGHRPARAAARDAAFTNTICFARKKTRPDEEGVIRSVTPFLLGVLRDNPDLVQWLQKEAAA